MIFRGMTGVQGMRSLMLEPLNARVYRVVTASGEHVGNLKLVGAIWKFKAIGYDAGGDVMPGGGPLTERHNTVFVTADEAELNARLCQT